MDIRTGRNSSKKGSDVEEVWKTTHNLSTCWKAMLTVHVSTLKTDSG